MVDHQMMYIIFQLSDLRIFWNALARSAVSCVGRDRRVAAQGRDVCRQVSQGCS